MARACECCRRRKIKCDSEKPACTSCRNNSRACVYLDGAAKPRPSTALLNAAHGEKKRLEDLLILLKESTADEARKLLDSLQLDNGQLSLPAAVTVGEPSTNGTEPGGVEDRVIRQQAGIDGNQFQNVSEDSQNMGLLDQTTARSIFESTSIKAVSETGSSTSRSTITTESQQNQLIAKAAIERHREQSLRSLDMIRGISADLVLHLLDLHWNRAHHTFLLTYRPAFMRELVHGGPYCTDLLLNAVLACSSKFSDRVHLRSDPLDPGSAGAMFFERCEQLLFQNSLLAQSQIPTVVALLMLGSSSIARGRISKGWLYTGYALRMVYDLNLHLDSKDGDKDPEQTEIRKRVFWGAFICEKLQSLYLGRPLVMGLRDSHVSVDFLDTFEELEPWTRYTDPAAEAMNGGRQDSALTSAVTTYSVSVFQQLCLLSRIMTMIIEKIYFTGATTHTTAGEVKTIDEALRAWYQDLPSHLAYEPWTREANNWARGIGPNRITLLLTYHFLVVLLHRPFISKQSEGVQRSQAAGSSWKSCATAARNIISLTLAYRLNYPLRTSSYLLSYAVYVACTVHVLNAAVVNVDHAPDTDSSFLLGIGLRCLDELALPLTGVADTARLIRNLMESKGVIDLSSSPAVESCLQEPWNMSIVWESVNASPAYDDFTQMQDMFNFEATGHDLLFGFMNEYPTAGFDPEQASM